MTRQKLKIGNTRGWSYTAVALTLLASVVAAEEGAIERCREEASPDKRIACLEAALSGGDVLPDDTHADQQSAVAAPASGEITPEPVDDDIAANVEADAVLSNSSSVVPPTSRSMPVPKAAAVAQAGVTEAPQPTAQTGQALGAEQLRTLAETVAELAAESGLAVESYTHFPYMRLEVKLANGQIWRQIKGDTQEVRATLRQNQTVDIEQSSLGGYKLRLNEMRRTIRVRRVK